ncbi:Ras GTPase domain-containing protein [Cavenderia fasciculata]|uniref:Ras GTPase domain-containing protein n=1 Tax=Cavenderia fasciculata TaxID=261658 RepID=F4PML3_CACFS|nr:Ras GTPase domain-containing protein [Cavenderia fasciculata]EGG22810.1 Ras GTPase domain-containing protein [Cavenderia fasciculata]|eukprot:XP_004360661.1 Ras GTPase domain-containing protein [Cavenderia fasciculata]
MFKLIEQLLSPSKGSNCRDKDKDRDKDEPPIQSPFPTPNNTSSPSTPSSSSTPSSVNYSPTTPSSPKHTATSNNNTNNNNNNFILNGNESSQIDSNGISPYGHNIFQYRCEVPIDNVIKILVLGGFQVGKTSLIRRYLQDIFTNQYIQTIGVDLNTMILQAVNPPPLIPSSGSSVQSSSSSSSTTPPTSQQQQQQGQDQIQQYNNQINFIVQFWDIAYPEIKGKNLTQLLSGTSGVILVFDSTNASSIVAMDECRAILKKYGINNNNNSHNGLQQIPIAIFANKSDSGDPVINIQDLDNYCKSSGFNLCRFTSTRKDVGVKDGIDKILELVLDIKKQEIEEQQRHRAKIILKQQNPHHNHNHHHHNHKHKLKSREKINNNGNGNGQPVPIISQSLPNMIINNNNNSPRKPIEQQQKNNENNNSNSNNNVILTIEKQEEQQRIDILKINELQTFATENYVNRFGKSLEELLQKTIGARYNDISMLEKQRNQEYIKICNSLKKLLQSPHQQHIRSHVGGLRIIVTREMIQSTLEENVKKWTRLIDNLMLEMSLDHPSTTTTTNTNNTTSSSSNKQSSSKSNRSTINSSTDSNISTCSSTSSSSLSTNSSEKSTTTPTMLFNHDNNNNSNSNNNPVYKSNNTSISLSVSYHPSSTNMNNNSNSSNSNSNNHNHHSSSKHHHHHHHHHSNRHGGNWKMGFGFRNNAKSSGIAFNNGNYSSVDTDNPVSSSSTISSSSSSSSLMSSSSASSSPIASPSTSPINHPSPSILPSSYNLTFHIPPNVQLSSPPLILTHPDLMHHSSPTN